jgi:ubiquinol oxidase
VEETPWLHDEPYSGEFSTEYGSFETLADLFRQIGYDERIHKLESIERMKTPRFQ